MTLALAIVSNILVDKSVDQWSIKKLAGKKIDKRGIFVILYITKRQRDGLPMLQWMWKQSNMIQRIERLSNDLKQGNRNRASRVSDRQTRRL